MSVRTSALSARLLRRGRKKEKREQSAAAVPDHHLRSHGKVLDCEGETRGTMSSTKYKKDKEIIADYETQVKGAV